MDCKKNIQKVLIKGTHNFFLAVSLISQKLSKIVFEQNFVIVQCCCAFCRFKVYWPALGTFVRKKNFSLDIVAKGFEVFLICVFTVLSSLDTESKFPTNLFFEGSRICCFLASSAFRLI